MTIASPHKKVLKIQILWICISCILILFFPFPQWRPVLFSLIAGLLPAVSFCSGRILVGEPVRLAVVLAGDTLAGSAFLTGLSVYPVQAYPVSSVLMSCTGLATFLVFSGFLCGIAMKQLNLLRQQHLLIGACRKKSHMNRRRKSSGVSVVKFQEKFRDR